MSASSRTSVGGILLEAIEGWSFSIRDGIIAGKRGTMPGVFRILSVSADALEQPLTHETCLRITADRIGAAGAEPSERQLFQSATGPLGSATFHVGKDQIAAWYCSRPVGLIIGAYACPAKLCATMPQYRFVRAQCRRMIETAMFDRSEWGGDDALTQIVNAELDLDPPPAPEPRATPADSPRPSNTPDKLIEPPTRPSRTPRRSDPHSDREK